MDVFKLHEQLIADYRAFTSGFADIHDTRIRDHVERRQAAGDQWPDPYLALNPNFAGGGDISELVDTGVLHPDCAKIFRIGKDEDGAPGHPLSLHQHQREAVDIARGGVSYVLTTGTGSGKSLSYIIPIVDSVLRQRAEGTYQPGVKAIVVYPMNALANSQRNELEKFLSHGFAEEPVTFRRYTGQDRDSERAAILRNPPDILLTNYVMLELVLTRPRERERLITAAPDLRFLVLDELHTYRGRAGADVGILVRRLREACSAEHLQCVGTSATMTTGGSDADRRATVADVASRLFGTPVSPAAVIGETLSRATSGDPGDLAAITERIPDGPRADTHAEFAADPFAAWVETRFGVVEKNGRLVRPPRPSTVPEAAADLARDTGRDVAACGRAIERTLQLGAALTDPRTRRPAFAFRLHQFLSKGDNVYLSVGPPDTRYITSRYQTVVPDSGPADRVLLPAAFCRECGQEYLVVQRTERDGEVRFTARRDADAAGGSAATGYLFISEDVPWPDSVEVAVTEQRLPESWLVTTADGHVVIEPRRIKNVPVVVHVDETGAQIDAGVRAAYLPSPFTFCLRCRVSYEQIRSSDFAKLASLAVEGRSSATSVVSASIVRSLREQPELGPDARKLLAFADNRQDASLQAGHFNDFIQVTQLRGALYRAVRDAPDGITHELVEQRVTDALGLSIADFAENKQARFTAERKAWEALRKLVGYRLYLDLERGWRITMPNLEQTGLLKIDYLDLPEIAAAQDLWADRHFALRDDAPAHRQEIMRALLDELRRVLAIDVDCFGDLGFEQLQKLSDQHLAEPWALPERERQPEPGEAFARVGGKHTKREHLYLSGYGAYGRYLLRHSQFPQTKLTRDDAQKIIGDLLAVLERCGLLTITSHADSGAPGYRLKAAAIIWRPGDGRSGAEDRVRREVAAEHGPRVNPFFQRLYAQVATTLSGLHAKEHTAQVSSQDRIDREDRFRRGDLPVLFCSPTMELGIDIASLNAVALRNVPPTPANYAQRAGRAGRSGQPALVTTYCSTGNAHDQYYFRHRDKMVGGSVVAPRLDLANEDLLRSHVHAVWLAETDLALDKSLSNIIDTGRDGYPLTAEVRTHVDNGAAKERAAHSARRILAKLWETELQDKTWWHDEWVDQVVAAAPAEFDRAMDRWRELYQAALAEQREQNKIVLDHASDHKTRLVAMGRRREAENQLRLLRNDDTDDYQTDFYSYRYLAAEGFLPGYSFPRLPLRAYVPGRRGMSRDAEFIQRPRFVAISEFGPGALVYHEGARYQVNQVQLAPTEDGQSGLDTRAARRCDACGYLHDQEIGTDVCQSCAARLGRTMHRLLRLQTVKAVRRERISSDEEERRRGGYELVTSYRFTDHGARPGRVDAAAETNGGPVLELRYGDTATVRVTNMGRRRRKDGEDNNGYWIDVQTGRWLSEHAAREEAPDTDELDKADKVERKQKVIPYVEDRRNVLITRFTGAPVDEATTVSFMYALERGIEAEFQLEDAELHSEPLPDAGGLGRVLFVESAEGGAGVLRRLVEEPGALARAARRALEICHFDPVTGADGGGRVDGSDERCARACYDCLLSYGNQGYHQEINRQLIRDLLLACAGARTVPAAPTDPAEAWSVVWPAGNGPVAGFLAWLKDNDHRCPAEVDVTLPDFSTRVDLVYRTANGPVAVVLGAAGPDREDALDDLRDAGWSVIAVPGEATYPQVVARYPSVFGVSRKGDR